MKGIFFRQAWQNLIQNLWLNTITLGTITLANLPYVKKIKAHPDVNVVTLKPDNRQEVNRYIVDRLTQQ